MSTYTDTLLLIVVALLCGMIYMSYNKSSKIEVSPTTKPRPVDEQVFIDYLKSGLFNKPLTEFKTGTCDGQDSRLCINYFLPVETIKYLFPDNKLKDSHICNLYKLLTANKYIASLVSLNTNSRQSNPSYIQPQIQFHSEDDIKVSLGIWGMATWLADCPEIPGPKILTDCPSLKDVNPNNLFEMRSINIDKLMKGLAYYYDNISEIKKYIDTAIICAGK